MYTKIITKNFVPVSLICRKFHIFLILLENIHSFFKNQMANFETYFQNINSIYSLWNIFSLKSVYLQFKKKLKLKIVKSIRCLIRSKLFRQNDIVLYLFYFMLVYILYIFDNIHRCLILWSLSSFIFYIFWHVTTT